VLKTLFALLALLAWQQPAAPPPGTDIYELPFSGDFGAMRGAKPQPVSVESGYDNQPFYTPDGLLLLFTANRDGKQTDIYAMDRKTRRVSSVTATPESEYSPAITPDGQGISVIRVEADSTQRLWQFDLKGANPRLVFTEIRPVGYHAWIDRDQLALFVLGKPSTLQHARVSTGKAAVVAESIGRSLHRIPGTSRVSFVHTENPKDVWVKEFDPATGTVTPLVQVVAGNTERDVAWANDGTLLMSGGTKIFAWRRGDKEWREVIDLAGQVPGAVTRMAVAPEGKSLAIVVTEK
jgi:dipeptidyl aminopeptidase/acylaminoacyl peptidase